MNYLGIEFGSTRIKAVAIDESYKPVSSGDYVWKSDFKDGVWTYDLEEVWQGLKASLAGIDCKDNISCMGVSAMMHGYLAFDEDWNLLVPFRTWQNTMTEQAADDLTRAFGFNIPQRWSVAHLYQAILNNEEHIGMIAHITTLAGYVHYMLTGVNALGVGDASGMFPIDSSTNDYDEVMLAKFDELISGKLSTNKARTLLPDVLPAGADAGFITEEGSKLLDGLLKAGIKVAPAEGDAGTGMTATNAVKPGTGNVSAGTSIFSMVVLKKPLANVHMEIDVVTTPAGSPVAMVHCNNCTNDMNAWVSVIKEAASLFGANPDTGELYTKLYEKSLEGDKDCGGVMTVNYMAGEGVTALNEGRPFVIRRPDSTFSLANLMRSQLYATMATLKTGMDILATEGVEIDSITGHGGLFKTPVVGQSYLAAACNTPVTVMETAGEGGPYGMALLAAYAVEKGNDSLEDFLSKKVFADAKSSTLNPDPECVKGFNDYIATFHGALDVERVAITKI
ncbi:MAG: ATPase [Saccharofermentans sp.]|nr:ATPase [Saccharofermentans sp.]